METKRIYSPGHLYHDGVGIWIDEIIPERKNEMQPRKLTTGFYRPTESFKSIPEHIAVMFEDNQTLVALVGASDDDPENLAETYEYAKLFASAPGLAAEIEQLKKLLNRCEPLLSRSKRIIANQLPGVPHTIETDLETLLVDIENELEASQ